MKKKYENCTAEIIFFGDCLMNSGLNENESVIDDFYGTMIG